MGVIARWSRRQAKNQAWANQSSGNYDTALLDELNAKHNKSLAKNKIDFSIFLSCLVLVFILIYI